MSSSLLLTASVAVLAFVLGAAPARLAAAAGADTRAEAGADTGAATTVQAVEVNARLNAARDQIQPSLGASVYSLDSQAIQTIPGGDNLSLNQVVLQAPGVAQDSFGQLHVRGEHNGLQYRLNGVILPEGLSVFGQALSPRLAGKVALITGALPAQFGLRTAGVVDITTKARFQNTGSIGLYGGAHGQVEPSFEYGFNSGDLNGFVSGSWMRSDLGIESPNTRATPLHDRTDQVNGFAYLEKVISPDSRLALILGSSVDRFQIPDTAGRSPGITTGATGTTPLVVNGRTGFDSARLNETQKELTHYGVVSYLQSGERFTSQLSVFARYSTLDFTPDPQGTLLFNGISQTAAKSDTAGGLQAEGVYHFDDTHTVRTGLIVQIDRSSSRTASQVIALAPDGAQTSDQPVSIIDNSANTSTTASLYLQDEWALTPELTLNYGLRYDRFNGFRDEDQLSPRVNLVWKPLASTTFHAGYSRYFTPPPFELVGSTTVAKFAGTTGASPGTTDTTPYAERSHYLDVGMETQPVRGLTLGVDSYYKSSRNLIDEGQFGAPIILTPFNYANGLQYGIELSSSYVRGPLSTYANLAYGVARGRNIITSQFNFDPAELAYIRTHFIYLDHAQRFTGSAGASYRLGPTTLSADLVYGSGLRRGGDIPNGRSGPTYTVVNLSVSNNLDAGRLGQWTARVDLINAFDKLYEIRDGSGVGVGAPQFGARRGLFVGVRREI
jgi:outer membrane receptor protein involved in Fe transport